MATTLGRLTIIFFIVWSIAYGKTDSLAIKMFDTQRQEIKEIGIGQPFTLEVTLKGEATSQGQPTIENLERINGRRSGYQMNSINGNATVVYVYQARVDTEGVYDIGPVRVGSATIPSFQVVVGQSKQLVNSKNAKKQQVYLQFFIDTHDVVIGEKIPCRLRFLYANDAIALKHIGQQDIPGFEQSKTEGPFVGTEIIDGVAFNYQEWQWSLAALKEGNYLIPAYYADYGMQKKRHAFWGSFAHLFDDHDVKRVYSNAEKIVVHAFDDAVYPVCAVGKDITIKASVDNAVVHQSEGITLRIDVTGDSSSSLRAIEALRDVAQELKWYRSGSSTVDASTLRSEFIIQGLKSGDYEIPSQHFCYFDRETREYKNIATEPILISIVPLRSPSNQNYSKDDHQLHKEQEMDQQSIKDQLPLSHGLPAIAQRATAGSWRALSHRAPMAWLFFIIIIIALTVGILFQSIVSLGKKLLCYKPSHNDYKKAFVNAYRAINHAQQNNDSKQLYAIFVQLLNARLGFAQERDDLEQREHELYNRLSDDALRARWKEFFGELEQITYGHNASHNDQLFKQANEWINILKKVM